MRLKKKIRVAALFTILTLLFLGTTSVSAVTKWTYQDNTQYNSLRVCNDQECINLADANKTDLEGELYVYEVGGDKIKTLDPYDYIMNNFAFLFWGALITLTVATLAIRYVLGRKNV